MRRSVFILLCFCLPFLLGGCQSRREEPALVDGLSTSQYSEITGRYFEETAGGFRAAFLSRDEIVSEGTAASIAARLPGAGYYQYIVSDPASWNMFLYYMPEGGLFGYYSFRFSVADSTVRVYVTADDSGSAFFAEYLLILVQAPSRGVWPTGSVLYVDGERIERRVDS